jgi:rod shape-determining protein MreC
MNRRVVKNLIIIIIILIIANLAMFSGFGRNLIYQANEFINAVSNQISETINGLQVDTRTTEEIQAENQIMKSNTQSLEKKVTQQEAQIDILAAENAELNAAINGKNQLSSDLKAYNNGTTNYEIIDGEVVVRNINDWNNKATINLGSNEGVETGDVVTYNGKYFGTVEEVFPDYSNVKLITSENQVLNVPAMAIMQSNEYNGIIKTYSSETNTLVFESYTPGVELTVGTKIYTNGYQENVPKGVMIGTITEVDSDDKSMKTIYKVTPAEDLYNAREIQVILNG